jgi:hypothetical protein
MNIHTYAAENAAGNVYILAPEGLDLPLCKIGRTKKDPRVRCAEINNSSTGDLRWAVAHSVSVDDCSRLESLIHQELDRQRQPRRELFQLFAEEAYARLRTLLEQDAIKEIALPLDGRQEVKTIASKRSTNGVRRKGDEAYAQMFLSFASRLQLEAPRPWGQVSRPNFGLSDDAKGVQWNIGVDRESNEACLGVNLEGMAYVDWPIRAFILSELRQPTLDSLKATAARRDHVELCFARDAWQMASRPRIVERYIGGRRFKFSEIDNELWRKLLLEARDCLDESKGFRGRAKQIVTCQTKSGETTKLMEVSPHLNIRTRIDVDPESRDQDQVDFAVGEAIAELSPVHQWVSHLIKNWRG